MSEEWNGNERRSGNVTLYDVLLEVRDVKNDLRHLVDNFNSHVKDDHERFEKITKSVEWTQRVAITGITIFAIFQFLVTTGAINLRGLFSSDDHNSHLTSNADSSVGAGAKKV